MSRVKRGVTSHAKHKKVYKAAKGFYGRRKNTIRAAKAAVEKAGQYAFRDRKYRDQSGTMALSFTAFCRATVAQHYSQGVRKVAGSQPVR